MLDKMVEMEGGAPIPKDEGGKAGGDDAASLPGGCAVYNPT
jgi:hypothetical protein